MKRKNIMQFLKDNYDHFSKGQQQITNYIINNYDKAAFMTAAALGQATNVSESTVVRFAIRLGYNGYRELQNDLQKLIKNKLTTIQRLNISKQDYTSLSQIISKTMKRDMSNIKTAIQEIDEDAFRQSIELVLKAKRIYIVGLRSSYFLAGYLNFYLNFLFDNVKLIEFGPNDIFEQLLKLSSEDVIIVITYPRYSKKIVEVSQYAKKKGSKIITITDSLISPVAQKANVALIASGDMLSFIDSLVAPMSVINAFIIALGAEQSNSLNNYFEELESIWEEYNIYD